MHGYECKLLTPNNVTKAVHDIQQRLSFDISIHTGAVIRKPTRETWDYREAAKAVILLSAYRLVDVCALLQGLHPSNSPVGRRTLHPDTKYPVLVAYVI